MRRRNFIRNAALLASTAARAQIRPSSDKLNVTDALHARGSLDQGPFDIDQDQGWQTILFTTPSQKPLRNPGLGLIGYTWEENGPSLAARAGRESLEEHVERLASLPFVDVLYIRCDWRDVQSRPGRLDFHRIWQLTLEAAQRHGLRVAFRIQMSNPEFEPQRIALPDFLRDEVPLVKIGPIRGRAGNFLEPRYDHPAFQNAFLDLNRLLAEKFDGDPSIEWVDLMMYGFWGEGHTSNLPNPFPDSATARRTFERMTEAQLEMWKATPLAVNTQPDISNVGNRSVLEMCVRAGAWLRSDSIQVEEPIQIDELANRPPWLAAILEDGDLRQYDVAKLATDAAGVNMLENRMLHALDLRANYWSLWTESANLRTYNERYPRGFEQLRVHLGYRLRPAWVWQRKRQGSFEVLVAIVNRGVSGVPGSLWLTLASLDGRVQLRGSLDRGQPHGGGVREASFLLPHGFEGSLHLSAAIEIRPNRMKPVAWACEQPVNSDGSITIDIKPESDPGWRKGV